MPNYAVDAALQGWIKRLEHEEFQEKIALFNKIHSTWEELKKEIVREGLIQSSVSDVEDLLSKLVSILNKEKEIIGIIEHHILGQKADSSKVLQLSEEMKTEFEIINLVYPFFGRFVGFRTSKAGKAKKKDMRNLLKEYRNVSSESRVKTLKLYVQFTR